MADRWYATGRRKSASARVYISKPGTGQVQVNKREAREYFRRAILEMIVNQPFEVTELQSQFDVRVSVTGGGLAGQAGAIKHGIARALVRFDSGLRSSLKRAGFLTRDPRAKERKKPGRPSARARFQFSKR
ncbi:MAG: 30S ribosomal protein S9 [Myxococcales bacterium]|nr:30S ribosomal protein S9 [Myxococcales bacterium]